MGSSWMLGNQRGVKQALISQPEPESLSPGTPGFPEQEEDELRTLGVERFEEILQEAGSRGGEEPGRSYGEEDFECEEADREGRKESRRGRGGRGREGGLSV